MQFSITRTDRATVLRFGVREQNLVTTAPAAVLSHAIVGPPMQRAVNGLASMGEELAAKAPDLTHSGAVKLALQFVASRVAGPFKEVQAAAPRAVADLERREAPVYRPRFDEATPPAVRVELRQFARGLPLPKLLAAVQSDATLAGAVVEGGLAMSGLPGDIFERVRRDMALGNLSGMMLESYKHVTPPTADDPIGARPDHEAARADAERIIAAWKAERETLAMLPDALSSIVTAVALMTDQSRADAFAGLTA